MILGAHVQCARLLSPWTDAELMQVLVYVHVHVDSAVQGDSALLDSVHVGFDRTHVLFVFSFHFPKL